MASLFCKRPLPASVPLALALAFGGMACRKSNPPPGPTAVPAPESAVVFLKYKDVEYSVKDTLGKRVVRIRDGHGAKYDLHIPLQDADEPRLLMLFGLDPLLSTTRIPICQIGKIPVPKDLDRKVMDPFLPSTVGEVGPFDVACDGDTQSVTYFLNQSEDGQILTVGPYAIPNDPENPLLQLLFQSVDREVLQMHTHLRVQEILERVMRSQSI